MQTIQVNGKEIKYTLRQGNSQQYVTLRFLSEDELEIILPKRHTVDINALLKKQASLIQRKHFEYVQASRQKEKLLLFGKHYDAEINHRSTNYSISLENNKLRVNLPESAKAKNAEYEYLKKWIKRQLLDILDNYLSIYKRKMQAPVNRIYIKNQKTRWASYTPQHNVNFNIKLAALPKNIIEYIVIHELAHTKYPSHNRKFWFNVQKFCSNYRIRRKELKEYSLVVEENNVWKKMLKEKKD